MTVNDPFTAALIGDNNVTVGYKIKNGDTALANVSTVLTTKNGDTTKTSTMTFVKLDAAPYAGSYTSTVTFEVSVVTPTP